MITECNVNVRIDVTSVVLFRRFVCPFREVILMLLLTLGVWWVNKQGLMTANYLNGQILHSKSISIFIHSNTPQNI